MKILLLAITCVSISVTAQFVLKQGVSKLSGLASIRDIYTPDGLMQLVSNWQIILGFSLYGLGAVAWLAVLSKWDVSKAYPIVGLGFAMTLVVGFFVGESVTPLRVVGVLLIASGVSLVAST